MSKFLKSPIFVVMALSFGAAYGQSVVIDGGNIRVDTGQSAKASVTTKSNKSAAGKKSKIEVIDGDSDSTTVIEGQKVSTSNGTSVETNTGGQRRVAGKGGKVFVNNDFSGQDLSRGNYAGASFTNVEAVGTNFRGVDLSNVVMTNVDLSKADLRGANLAGAQMTNVDWEGAQLGGAIWLDGRRCAPTSVGSCK